MVSMKRIGIFGWGIVAPKSPDIDSFEKNLGNSATWLEPFKGFGPSNFIVGTPEFNFGDYKDWIDARFEPRRFSQLKDKMGDPVKYAIGAFIQALGQNPALEPMLRELGLLVHVYVGTCLGDLPIQFEITRTYHKAQHRWNRFWCKERFHPELAAYRRSGSGEKNGILKRLGAPPDPADLPAENEDLTDVQEDWYAFWVNRSEGLKEYLKALKKIEGESISGDIDTTKSHLMRRKIAARRKLNTKYGCPTEPWMAVDAQLLWNIHNISASQISMLGRITGPTLAPEAACSGFGTALKLGIDAIRTGQARVVVAGGTEPPPHPLSVGTFYNAHVHSHDGDVSKPFTGMRGTHVAGGSCIWIIGDAEYLMGLGLKPLGLEIVNVTMTSDADHIITPSKTGPGAAIKNALQDAGGIKPEEVANWDMHATATPGDWTELQLSMSIFPSSTRLTARKGLFGHGMSVSGGWELTAQHMGFVKGEILPVDLSAREMNEKIRPYSHYLTGKEPEIPKSDIAGKISMGVGGINTCVICRKWNENKVESLARRQNPLNSTRMIHEMNLPGSP